jgi:diguanylate cyclase (GGDEF)-like protein
MSIPGETHTSTMILLKSRALRPSVYGVAIALVAVVTATLLVAAMQEGGISLASLLRAQRSNFALWILDLMPFIFALWGHYVGSVMVREAQHVVSRRASELRTREDRLQSEIARRRDHDALTGLANRQQLVTMLEESIRLAEVTEEKIGLFVLDVIGFRDINAIVGHERGDQLLKRIAAHLCNLPVPLIAARLSGDEFAVIHPDLHGPDEIERTSSAILAIFEAPMMVDGVSLMIDVGLGLSIFPGDADHPDAMLQHAYTALHVSKARQKGMEQYRSEMEGYTLPSVMLKAEIRQSIAENTFLLTFQPKVNRRNQVKEAEVLLRWRHPQKGELQPDEFIPFVEKSKMNHELLAWLLRQTIWQASVWMESGIDIALAVNLSALDLGDAELPTMIKRLLEEHSVPPERLKLEITESAVMEDQDQALTVLDAIAELGVGLSIDDFGTGFSSLSYLSRLPVHELKLDQSFVRTMLADERNALIVQAIVDLAHQLELKVVAEGIEDKHIMKAIRHTGCDMLQGYYISRPMEAGPFETWYRRWQEKRQDVYLRTSRLHGREA